MRGVSFRYSNNGIVPDFLYFKIRALIKDVGKPDAPSCTFDDSTYLVRPTGT